MKSDNNLPATGLLGGSFNPLHIGHLRLCMEILEQTEVERIELIPAHIPPHKDLKNILPFDMRCAMMESAVADIPQITVNRLERERPGPSYTYDTLKHFVLEKPRSRVIFIMGHSDLLTIPEWYRGREIPFLADLIVAGREGGDEKSLDSFISRLWDVQKLNRGLWTTGGGRTIRYLSIPRIDVSSSMIRARWLAGRSIDWLVPQKVKRHLDMCTGEIKSIWKNDPETCK